MLRTKTTSILLLLWFAAVGQFTVVDSFAPTSLSKFSTPTTLLETQRQQQRSPTFSTSLAAAGGLGFDRFWDWDRPTSATTAAPTTGTSSNTLSKTQKKTLQLKSYEYDGYKLNYLYKPASPKFRNAPPVLLIHPVGIGMSSWFWERFMSNNEDDGPAMYAVDLIGCGLAHGADAWDPNQRGMSVPLAWVEACEALMQEQFIGKKGKTSSSALLPFLSLPNNNNNNNNNNNKRYTVVAQGGLAPVGVLLAARNTDTVDKLVLTSPPTDLSTAVTEKELAKNYGFFAGKLSAPLAFGLLETRAAVQFFSNLFLFEQPCDEEWLQQAALETCEAARAPVQVFNAGFCQARSYDPELQALDEANTKVLILQGRGDTPRNKKRSAYFTSKLSPQNCQIETLPGKNVLPWESPVETAQALRKFMGLA